MRPAMWPIASMKASGRSRSWTICETASGSPILLTSSRRATPPCGPSSKRGAFTGAVRRKLGKFELAHRGTIFLDEIGTISPAAQTKLLQVLQERTFQRVGGEALIETDVRIIAASNTALGQMGEKGLFRNDIYYRLNVFPIRLPPLRERREDISQLTEIFLRQMNRFNKRGIP